MRKNIKNYTSEVSVDAILQQMQQMLVRAGARSLMFTYTAQGEVEAIAFSIQARNAVLPIRLPARVAQVAHVLYGSKNLTPAQWRQAQRTAWKNLHDWVDAQLALIETEMVKLEEVFLPYLVTNRGATLFEVMEQQDFLLPSSGQHPA
jgi:hypothetical protein